MLFLTWFYFFAVAVLMLFGSHRTYMALRSVARGSVAPTVISPARSLPTVCVQLPLFNEPRVAERLIRSVMSLSYPKEKLEVQVLDDSTDQTRFLTKRLAQEYREKGYRISLIQRRDRRDFKAGALRNGLAYTSASVLVVFDADFVPAPDFLLKTVPLFQKPQVGFVQVRWSYLNRKESFLTRAQGILLDGHFLVEHSHRFGTRAFFNFNGTAGLWRREAIESSGNWQGDTITEDLDLSYRAQLGGWRGVYLCDYTCDSELPARMTDFKSQQYRWTKGSVQVCKKLFASIIFAPVSARIKMEALFHLTSSVCYLLGVLVALLLAPVAAWRSQSGLYFGPWFELVIFLFTFGSLASFYVCAQMLAGRKLRIFGVQGDTESFSLMDIGAAIVLGVGISITCGGAVLSGLGSRVGEFVRTPKSGGLGVEPNKSFSRWQSVQAICKALFVGGRGFRREALMCLYLLFALSYSLSTYGLLSAPFLLLMLFAYFVIVAKVTREQFL